MQGTSRGDIQHLLCALFGVDIAIGTVDNTLTALAQASAAAVDQIWHHVNAQGVAHADETGWHVRGKLGWMWSAIVAGDELAVAEAEAKRLGAHVIAEGKP